MTPGDCVLIGLGVTGFGSFGTGVLGFLGFLVGLRVGEGVAVGCTKEGLVIVGWIDMELVVSMTIVGGGSPCVGV